MDFSDLWKGTLGEDTIGDMISNGPASTYSLAAAR